ncbi:hypothetical protein [Cryptosporangium minutisporangium]
MDEYGEALGDRRLAQVAAERHPEAHAAELPESWAGLSVDWVLLDLADRAPRSPRLGAWA